MNRLSLRIDDSPINMSPSAVESENDVLVPVVEFASAVGAEVKVENGRRILCREDLCIPIDSLGNEIRNVEGTDFVSLSAFGLTWRLKDGELYIRTGSADAHGLNVGQRPPVFTLPDIDTGIPVSSESFQGRKTAFFMWASW